MMSPAARTPTSETPTRRFAAWAIIPWVMLLLAALGFVQYLRHGEYLYLGGVVVVIVVCTGCIMRQAWSRPAMRVLALLLALWSLTTAVLMLQQLGDFEVARQHAAAQPQSRDLALWLVARAERIWHVGIALKVLATPVLLWLVLQLGRPGVRIQFRPRRR